MQISSAHQFLFGKLNSMQARYAALEQTYLQCTEALKETIFAIEQRLVPDTPTMDRYKKLAEPEPGHNTPPRSTLTHDKSDRRRGGWMERSVPLVAAVLSQSWDRAYSGSWCTDCKKGRADPPQLSFEPHVFGCCHVYTSQLYTSRCTRLASLYTCWL